MLEGKLTLRTVVKCSALATATLALVWPAVSQMPGKDNARDLRNLKNISTAMLLYSAAQDDLFPVFFTNITGGVCAPNDPQVCNVRSMWQFHIAPYRPNWKEWSAPDEPESGDSRRDAFNLSYGYNYAYLSTLCVANDGGYAQVRLGCAPRDFGSPGSTMWFQSVPMSLVKSPDRIVLLTDSGGKDLTNTSVMGSAVNPPDAWPSEKYVFAPVETGWGKNCITYFHKDYSSTGRWGDTDGFAPRYDGRGNIVLTDGHVEPFRSVSEMTAGTAWNPTSLCTIMDYVTEYAKYRWDPRYNEGRQRRSDQ